MIKKRPPQLRVFLCYAKEDVTEVRKIYKRLIEDGFDAWLDEEKLLVGQNWKNEIINAERNSDAILICLSKASLKKEGVVHSEIQDALEIAKEKPTDVIFVLPVRLDECDVPHFIRKYHWADWFSENGPAKLMKALHERAKQINEAKVSIDNTKGNIALQTDPTKKKAHR